MSAQNPGGTQTLQRLTSGKCCHLRVSSAPHCPFGLFRRTAFGHKKIPANCKASSVVCRLQFEHFSIASATPEKLMVRPLLGNRPVFQHEDAIGHANRGKTVRN